jgi:hypothetical protein
MKSIEKLLGLWRDIIKQNSLDFVRMRPDETLWSLEG